MAGLIQKNPFVGFATSLLFGALGVLLVRLDAHRSALTTWLFKFVGYFALFVASSSLVTALYALVKGVRKQGR